MNAIKPAGQSGVIGSSPTQRAPRSAAGHGARARLIRDRVEISQTILAASRQTASAAVRPDLVQRLRVQIAAGTYETPQRIDAAVDRLFAAIAADSAGSEAV